MEARGEDELGVDIQVTIDAANTTAGSGLHDADCSPLGLLEVGRLQSVMLGGSHKHSWPDLGAVVKCKNVIWPTLTLQYPMRATSLTLDAPSNLQKSLQDLLVLRRSPRTHADTVKTSASSSDSSPASIRSASIRNTSDSTFRIAWSAVSPYASAPGISGTSAIYRPSTSVSTSMRMRKGYSIALDVQDGFLVSNRWIFWRT